MQYIDCSINPISRQVSYPGAIIVQRDTNVEALRFHYSLQAEHELENDSIRVMVKTAKEIRGFNAENVRIETNDGGDEELVFEHTITRYETEVPGQINVSVCGNQISGDTITEAWHTLNMSFQVGSSVHTDSDEGEDSEETKASNAEKIAALQTLVDAITSGRPIPVDAKSKMTDTSAIYLYTGNETGEQHNYWYYHDGTTWVPGSEYGGITIDDELSSTSENAVQNKVIKANFDELNGRLTEQITSVTSRIQACENELGTHPEVEYVLPEGYESIDAENSAHTQRFKYIDGEISLYMQNPYTGECRANEVTSRGYDLDALGYAVDASKNQKLAIRIKTCTYPSEANPALAFRFYNSDYSSSRGAYVYLTEAGDIDVDLKELAEQYGVNLSTYPNFIIRALGHVAYTSEAAGDTMEVTIPGFFEPVVSTALSDRVSANETNIAKNSEDIDTLSENVGRLQRQQGIIAEAFSAQSTYDVGDSVIYEAGWYTFKADKSAGAWDATKVDGPFKVTDQISSIKEDLSNTADTKTMCIMPDGYKSANYSNASATKMLKWKDNSLNFFVKFSAGEISASEMSTGAASITANANTVIDISNAKSAILNLRCSGAIALALYIEYYDSNLSKFKGYSVALPASGLVTIDLLHKPLENAFSPDIYPYVFIRKISWAAHTATSIETETLSIYGFKVEPIVYKESSTLNPVNPFRFKPRYAHLFINTVSDAEEDTYVPSQSEYDIEISKRLGFDVIEVNVHTLSDGEYICCHGIRGTFGTEFKAASDSTYTDTEVQNTTIGSVNLAWVRANVRFKAKYPKMRVSPLTLEEFLLACRRNFMIPLIGWSNIGQVRLADKIMGKDNYILYGANLQSRAISKALFMTWSNLTTADQYTDFIKNVGVPACVGVINYSNFTKTQWAQIIKDVHDMGGLMAVSEGYMSISDAQDLWDVGVDIGGSLYPLNPSTGGDVISSGNGFTDFTITDGAQSDGVVSLTQNGTIAPILSEGSSFLIGMWLDVTFVGTISVAMGRFITHSTALTADESRTIHLSTYAINSAPTFEIKAGTGGASIQNIVFRHKKM